MIKIISHPQIVKLQTPLPVQILKATSTTRIHDRLDILLLLCFHHKLYWLSPYVKLQVNACWLLCVKLIYSKYSIILFNTTEQGLLGSW